MLKFIGIVFVLILSACGSVSVEVGSQDAGVDSGIPEVDSGSEELDAGTEATCYVTQDVYVKPGEDPTVGFDNVLSCTYMDITPPVVMGKPTNLTAYRCVMLCYKK